MVVVAHENLGAGTSAPVNNHQTTTISPTGTALQECEVAIYNENGELEEYHLTLYKEDA